MPDMPWRYAVTLERDDNDTLIAELPGLPEVTTYGTDEADALARALDAALTVLAHRMKDGEAIPPGDAGPHSRPAVTLPSLAAAKIEVYRAMKASGVRKAELARRLDCHRSDIDRLLSLRHGTRMTTIDKAMTALGRTLVVSSRAAA